MDELTKLVLTGAGSVGVTTLMWVIVQQLWKTREKKRDQAEEKVERSEEKKLDEVLSEMKALRNEVVEMRSEARAATVTAAAMRAEFGEVKSRVNGISADYGHRIGQAEKDIVRHDERLKTLERKAG